MWLRPQGHATIFNPDGPTVEFDTMTCGHCQRVTQIGPGQRPEDIGGLCKCCFSLICGPCVDKGTCVPFEKKLEEVEARDRFRRQIGI
jgi:hypothetical protein